MISDNDHLTVNYSLHNHSHSLLCIIRKYSRTLSFKQKGSKKSSALILSGLQHLHTDVAAHPLAQLTVWHAFNNWPFNCRQMKSDVK